MKDIDIQNDTNMIDDFDRARWLVLSYYTPNISKKLMIEALTQVRDTCTEDTFNRLLVLLEAANDNRFREYGTEHALPILRHMPITKDVRADVELLLEAMKLAYEDAWLEAQWALVEEQNPYRLAAERLYNKFREPNIEQVMYELAHL